MAIMRKPKQQEFTMIDNYLINDINLKPESKGYLVFMLSKPDNWQFNYAYLSKALGVGEKAISSNIKKLENLKYLKRERINDENGHYVWIYNVYERPYDLFQELENQPSPFKGGMVTGDIVGGGIYKDYNNKDYIDKIDKTSSEGKHSIYTKELIRLNYITANEINISYYDKLFNEYVNNGYSKSEIYMVIHYIVTRVIGNNYKDENGEKITNKFGYFKSSMASNFDKFKARDELFEFDWLNDMER